MSNKTKECNRCGDRYDLELFHAGKTGKDGIRPYCKYCAADMMRLYRATGSTTGTSLKDKSTDKLRAALHEIKIEMFNRGIKLCIAEKKVKSKKSA